MNLSLTPDTYTPNVDENGNYIDNIPIIKNGIACICGSRKDKIYSNTASFSAHIKTQRHQKWLSDFNKNKANYYVELIKANELIKSQKIIIIELSNELERKSITIDTLTSLYPQNPVKI